MIQIESGIVLEIIGQRPGVVEWVVEVNGQRERAIQYTGLSAPVVPGQRILLNTTAVRLGLGSGGYHFVVPANLNFTVDTTTPGHIMKLRYTPEQIRVWSCEEPAHPVAKQLKNQDSLHGMLVIAAELHSMLPALVATISYLTRQAPSQPKIVYLMTDGGALPIQFSKTVLELKEKGLLTGTVTVGHAFGGDLEAVNLYSGLLAAKYGLQADLTIVAMGPGIVGTGSKFGHTGIEQGQVINATASLAGVPVVCPRISFADKRPRHFGISHHTLTILEQVALAKAIVPLPILETTQMWKMLQQLQQTTIGHKHVIVFEDGSIVQQAVSHYDLTVTTMGRQLAEDPPFFLAAGATGLLVDRMLKMRDAVKEAF